MSLHPPKNFDLPNTASLRFGIAAACYNKHRVDSLLERMVTTLKDNGVSEKSIRLLRAPGSNELPYLAYMLARSGTIDCVLALGVVIGGETDHHNRIGDATAQAFHQISFQTQVPIINGVLVTDTAEQTEARCGDKIDRGAEFARAALQMAALKVHLLQGIEQTTR